MAKNNKKFILYFIITILLTLGLSISLQSLLAAWNPPTASPPGSNAPAPIYSSAASQIINGDLGITGNLSAFQITANGDFYANNHTIYMGGADWSIAFSPTYPDYGIFYDEGSPDKIVLSADGGGAADTDFVLYGDKVGIGTAGPSEKLEVNGTVKATSFTGDGSGLTGISTGKWSDGAGGVIYYDSGNIGIRTTTPGAELDVNGKIRMRSVTTSGDSDNIVATKGYVDDTVGGTGGVEVYSGTHSGWTQCQGHLFATVSDCVSACGAGYCTYEGRLSTLEVKTKVVKSFSAGTSSWTKPAGVTIVEIKMAGGGGSSGGGAWHGRINGAGGGAAYLDGTVELPVAETTYTITVGAGGASVGTGCCHSGLAGGTTRFATGGSDLLIARGGGGGWPGIHSYVSPGCTGDGGTYTIGPVTFVGAKEHGTQITVLVTGEYRDCIPDGPGTYGGGAGTTSASIAGSDGYLELVYYE